MSSDSIRGNLYVGDIGALEPFEGQDRLLELFRQFLVWHGQREPVVPGDPFTKFATKGFLVDMGVLTENQVIGDDDHEDPDVAEIDEPRVYAYARDFEPDSTTPCAALSTISMGTGKPDARVLAFDSATNEAAQVQLIMPPEWPGNAVQVRLYWSHSLATSWDVVWQVQAHTAADGESFDALFGPGFEATDTGGDPSTIYISASSVLTITTAASAAQAGDLVFIKVTRRPDLAGDTLNGDAYLHAIEFRIGGVPSDFPPPETDSTWDAATDTGSWTFTNADKTVEAAFGVAVQNIKGTLGRDTGLRYFEILAVNTTVFGTGVRHDLGVTSVSATMPSGGSYAEEATEKGACYRVGGKIIVGNVDSGAVTTVVDGDVIGVAHNLDSGDIWFHLNGTWTQGDPSTLTSPEGTLPTGTTYYPAAAAESGADLKVTLRTKASEFSYSIPTGFVSWASD